MVTSGRRHPPKGAGALLARLGALNERYVPGRLRTRRSSSRHFDLACCAVPFGYGPVSKLLAIVQRARADGAKAVFVGTGVAHKLASRSDLFEDIVEADPGDRATWSVLADADHVVCVMDPDFARVALELSQPLSVVDSLFWMWHQIPESYLKAKQYWVQNFYGVEQRAARLPQRPQIVGPILPSKTPSVAGGGAGLLVNLGGCETPFGRMYEESPYVDVIVQSLARSALADVYRDRTLLIAGQGCIDSIKSRLAGLAVNAESLSLSDAEAAFQQADLILTAPGLTATLQAFRSEAPALFLPPQNYSQWLILNLLREHGLAPRSFHWKDVMPADPVAAFMPESVAVPRVTAAICELAARGIAQNVLAARLSSMLLLDLKDLSRRQQDAFASWNVDDGAGTIADAVTGGR
jgi:hypothetical protein